MNKKLLFAAGTLAFALLFLVPGISCAQSPPKGADVPPSYQIGPNDVLSIYVWKEAELTRDVTVTPDGKISFPLIGEVVAEGRTVMELKQVITDKLQNFVTAPEVTVIVKESRSRIVYTIGKVTKPGPYPLAPDMTVLQALSAAGGFAEWADTKHVLIIRREGGKETQFRFNYKEYTSGDNVGQNIVIKPGDTIVVP
jgi:polysaccharide export outer membrane protein